MIEKAFIRTMGEQDVEDVVRLVGALFAQERDSGRNLRGSETGSSFYSPSRISGSCSLPTAVRG